MLWVLCLSLPFSLALIELMDWLNQDFSILSDLRPKNWWHRKTYFPLPVCVSLHHHSSLPRSPFSVLLPIAYGQQLWRTVRFQTQNTPHVGSQIFFAIICVLACIRARGEPFCAIPTALLEGLPPLASGLIFRPAADGAEVPPSSDSALDWWPLLNPLYIYSGHEN